MNKSYLIPLAALTGGVAGCGSPDYVGDWELTKLTSRGAGEVIVMDSADGDLKIDKDGNAELKLSWVEKYDGTSYSYSIDAEGDALDRGDDAAKLDMSGEYVDSFNDSYSVELDIDCEADRDEMHCEGDIVLEGLITVGIEAEFEAK